MYLHKEDTMDIKNIKRKQRKNIVISIRVSKAVSAWLKENNYSPTKVFYEAIKDIGFNE